MIKPIFFNGEKIGVVNEKRQFVAEKTYRNLFRVYNGFGLSLKVIRDLKNMGVKTVIFLYKHNGITDKLMATPNDFLERGYRHPHKDFDIHFILPLNDFNQLPLTKFVEAI